MATKPAHKRLTREYAHLLSHPVEYINAHPSESNILEWHYILTGPPDTPYAGGQYWGTLTFPSDYPFAPPAIRMHTPSGRFRPSDRLCLSISDFHPKSFNPAWAVSTILLGVLSFMTSEEMTTGSIKASDSERREYAAKSRWWNSTGGGSAERTRGNAITGFGAIKLGDGGKKFRNEFPELDEQNKAWMMENKVDPQTGISANAIPSPDNKSETTRVGPSGSLGQLPSPQNVVERGWLWNNWKKTVLAMAFLCVLVSRVMSD
ncbi:UBC-like protein [Piedraia hortae CBS 480.64]|uniref:UBC-like protein n=1 Tax=Piedraia hortae CBS 480.64 TaxID=1314780 RepID=A0A6A7C7X9_9PEZI|nr:UBC-like protein [Piedraia hortae CBS 480.64]